VDGIPDLPDDLKSAHGQILSLLERQRGLEQQLQELTRIATTDELTGLRNRRYFAEDVKAAFATARGRQSTFSLVLLDVDHFKRFNDSFGHQAGDRVLTIVAELMSRQASGDNLAIRLGGEEFVLLMPGADELRSIKLAEEIRTSVQDYRWPQGSITASLGVSTLRAGNEHVTEVIEEADIALYYSKRHGRNQASHFSDLTKLSKSDPSRRTLIAGKRLVSRRRHRDLPT